LTIWREQKRISKGFGGITAYHLTNFGTNADIDVYHLPLSLIEFAYIAETAKYKDAWGSIVSKSWEVEKLKKQKKNSPQTGKQKRPRISRRNHLYEDLFDLPDNARRFLRVYFLRLPLKHFSPQKIILPPEDANRAVKKKTTKPSVASDPRENYSVRDEADMVSWDLTSLFLRKVMNMDKVRIDSIRQLADRLTEHVQHQDVKLFTKIFNARRYKDLSLDLLKASKESVKAGKDPLFTFNQFVEIFEESEDTPRMDWSLARDLILIRMIEQLHTSGWWKKNTTELEESSRETVEAE